MQLSCKSPHNTDVSVWNVAYKGAYVRHHGRSGIMLSIGQIKFSVSTKRVEFYHSFGTKVLGIRFTHMFLKVGLNWSVCDELKYYGMNKVTSTVIHFHTGKITTNLTWCIAYIVYK